MSGIIAVYGLVMAVLIAGSLNPLENYSLYKYVLFLSRLTLNVQWDNTFFIRDVCWVDGSRSRILHWNCRRSRCTELPSSAKDLCGSSAYIDFCRGIRIIWVNRGIDIKHTSRTCTMLMEKTVIEW